jgi:hypothetical protein
MSDERAEGCAWNCQACGWCIECSREQDATIATLRAENEELRARAEKSENTLRIRGTWDGSRTDPGIYYDVIRPPHLIAGDLFVCAIGWQRDVRIVGNIRACELEYLATWAMQASARLTAAIEHVPEFVGEDDPGAGVFGALCCPNGEPGHFWKDGCPSHCWDGVDR